MCSGFKKENSINLFLTDYFANVVGILLLSGYLLKNVKPVFYEKLTEKVCMCLSVGHPGCHTD